MSMDGLTPIGTQGYEFTGNPEIDAQNYAKLNGISVREAKEILRKQCGEPQQQPNSVTSGDSERSAQIQQYNDNNSTPEQRMLLSKRIPPEVIVQGDDAIRKFAEENNISLPSKSAMPENKESNNMSKNDSPEQKLKDLGIPEYVISQGDDAIRKFAEENNISLPPKGAM